ncbi:hypothetical protein V1511DRAFT_241193 [Dipodascopsis uninucleata]
MPTATFLKSQLRKVVWYSLDNGLDSNALFAAERLAAEDASDLESIHLLAHCHYVRQRYKSAMRLTEDKKHIGCVYIYALCCLKLGKFRQGCKILERGRSLWPKSANHIYSHSDSERQVLPDLSSVQCLLGHLYRNFGDSKEAMECYSAALSSNPFLWEAFDGLCKLGVNIRVGNIYRVTQAMIVARASWLDNGDDLTSIENSQNHDPFVDPITANEDTSQQFIIRREGSSLFPGKSLHHVLETSTASELPIMSNGADSVMTDNGNDEDAVMHGTSASPSSSSSSHQTPISATPSDPGRSSKARSSRLKVPDAPRRSSHAKSSSTSSATEGRRSTELMPTRRSSRLSQVPSSASAGTSGGTSPATRTHSALGRATNVVGNGSVTPSSTPAIGSGTSASTSPGTSASSALRDRLRSGLLKSKLNPSIDERRTSGIEDYSDGSSTGQNGNSGADSPQATDVNSNPTGSSVSLKVPTDDSERIEAEATMLSLYQTLAVGHLALSRYECRAALQAFMSLSANHQETPYVLSQIGKAYFEIVRYKESEQAFRRLRQIDPTRVEDMEIYSTLLWHLRKDVELSFLAHELADIDRNSPQAWVAIGNSFSLQKEHDQALKCFRRASFLDPTFAYAYTLQGHEHVANEEFESAQNAFRLAMRAEWRHYNAWYGIGMVFLKTGKFDLAEQHFRQAALINPGNAVLICCIGMVLEKLMRLDDALVQYDIACKLQPTSALPRFKKARLLMSMKRYQACMDELRIVKNLAPDESSVHYLLGRLYKVRGEKQNAIRHFTAALNLDPKASHVIKEAIEGLETDAES